jgi:hypothetical protein
MMWTPWITLYWTLIAGLAFLIYLALTEPNFPTWINLQYKIFITETKLIWYRWWLNPRNPISRWVWNRRLKKLTEKEKK